MPPSTKKLPLSTVVVTVLVCLLATLGCADSEPDAERRGTAAGTQPESASFAIMVADLFVAIMRAGSDQCAISKAVPERPLAPRTDADTTLSVGLHVAWIRAVANSESDPTVAAQLHQSSERLMEAAVAAGFPADFWDSDAALLVISDPAYAVPMASFEAAVASCGNDTATAGGANGS